MVDRILVATLCGVGDCLLFLPALRLLRERHPLAKVDFLTFANGTEDLLQGMPGIHRVYTLRFRRYLRRRSVMDVVSDGLEGAKLFWRLRRERYDVIVWPFAFTTWKKRLIARVLGPGRNIMHYGGDLLSRHRLFRGDSLIAFSPQDHFTQRNLKLLEPLGVGATEAPQGNIELGTLETGWARSWICGQLGEDSARCRKLGVLPGGNLRFNPHRQWGLDQYAKVAEELARIGGYKVFLFGVESERPLLDQIARGLSEPPGWVCGLPLRRAVAVALEMDLFIGNDSSLLHATAMSGVRTFAILGPTNPRATGPVGTCATSIRLDLPCSPCYESGFSRLCPHHACLRRLSAESVAETIFKISQDGGRSSPRVVSLPPPAIPELTPRFMRLRTRWSTRPGDESKIQDHETDHSRLLDRKVAT